MPTPAVPLMPRRVIGPWEQLVLIGFQVKYNLQKGLEKWETDFRDQIKNYLLSLPEGAQQLIASDIIKVSIVKKGGQPSLNRPVIENTFKNSIRNGSIPAAELQALFDAGVLGIAKHEEALAVLTNRGILPAGGPYNLPGDPATIREELRWQVLIPEAGAGSGVLADLPDRVHAASGARLSEDDISLMLPRAAPLTEPEAAAAPPAAVPQPQPVASDTVAVRRVVPRRRRQANQPPAPEQP